MLYPNNIDDNSPSTGVMAKDNELLSKHVSWGSRSISINYSKCLGRQNLMIVNNHKCKL